jgi:hypothetical protein
LVDQIVASWFCGEVPLDFTSSELGSKGRQLRQGFSPAWAIPTASRRRKRTQGIAQQASGWILCPASHAQSVVEIQLGGRYLGVLDPKWIDLDPSQTTQAIEGRAHCFPD